jgi:hypothetical protein
MKDRTVTFKCVIYRTGLDLCVCVCEFVAHLPLFVVVSVRLYREKVSSGGCAYFYVRD